MTAPAAQHTSSNQNAALSDTGRNQLIQREGLIRHYYNDSVNNCTYGAGTLAHLGPCSDQELQTAVDDTQLATSLQHGINLAERAIRRNVTRQDLTQDQFDALVSFTYNVGAGGARNVLRQVDSGQFGNAVQTMSQYIHATVRGPDGQPRLDRNGRRITRVLPGLVTRRTAETAPFRPAQ